MIELFGLSVSAACAKVEIVMQNKQLEYQLIAPPGGSYTALEFHALNPAGTIPAIRHDLHGTGNAFVLHDSDAICEYLEDVYPTPMMRAKDLQTRARHRALARFLDTRLDPAVRSVFPLFAVSDEPDSQHLSALVATLSLRLTQLDRLIDPSPFLEGDNLCLADCGYLPTIRMAQTLFGVFGETIQLPARVDTWCDALSSHSVVAGVLARNQKALHEWLQEKGWESH